MNILVTGGAGYIGSHTCVELLEAGYKVIIADNLSNSNKHSIAQIERITQKKVKFFEIDVTNREVTERIFKENIIDGIIHFAGYKAVGQSIIDPISYYNNNVFSTLLLAELSLKYNVKHFVFSSSATVYGENTSPLKESMGMKPTTNPYGESKAMCERILTDIALANEQLTISILRYFNPVGAHNSGLIGENPNGFPNNLMPYITKVAKGELEYLEVFGDDYPTPDGTGIRDYIHVVDLAAGHVAALGKNDNKVNLYNLGTGKGTSVLQLVKTFEGVNNVNVPYIISGRRKGDVAISFADPTKAQIELNWVAKYKVSDMCRDAWRFERNNKLGK